MSCSPSKLGVVALALFAITAIDGRRASAAGEEIAVIVHKSNAVGAMDRSQLSAIFRAQVTEFPKGGRASPVNLPPDNAIRQQFDLAVLGMTPDEVERYWLDSKIRSGVGSPRKLSGPDSVVHYVESEETGIGYVSSSDVIGAVRVAARVRDGRVVPP